jgi:peptidoglycan lytic transglycosylase D
MLSFHFHGRPMIFKSELHPYHTMSGRQCNNNDRALYKTTFRIIQACLLLLLFALLTDPAKVQADAGRDEFPEFPSIRNNIKFWEKIYLTYSINTAVIHDQNDVTKIYDAVALVDKDFPDARNINNNRVKRIKEKYSQILLRLSAGSPPTNKDESRIAAMFKGPSAFKEMRVAAENIRVQNGLKERFYEGAIRSIAYFKKFQQILKAYGVPEDLAYLPHVESSFNPQAYSKSGASGIWQFTRSTGKQYMTINRRVDQRRDPFISTRAAAKLLKKNYEALGSWPLAITAYNYGTSGMMRAAQAHGDYVDIFKNYREGYFKFASRNFYSEFLAARNIAKKLVGKQLPNRKTIAASSAHPRTVNDGPSVKAIKATRTKLIVSQPSRPIKHLRAVSHPRFYVVRQGDTAGSIAAAHNISVHRLCKENNLGPKAVIRIGQNLKIPVHISSNGQKTNLQSSVGDRRRSSAMTSTAPRHNLAKNIPSLSNVAPDKRTFLQADET